MKKEPQQQTEHICISINLRHQILADKISGKKKLEKKLCRTRKKISWEPKMKQNFTVFKIDVRCIQI